MVQKRKKTSAKKKESKRRRKTYLSNAEIEYFKQMLLQKRRELMGDVNEIQDEALKQSRLDAAGDLSSMPIHMADLGTDNYQQEFALELVDGERKLLRKIDDALERIELETYGICEGTGEPIPKVRLEARPWARYGVEYARMLENGKIIETEEEETEEEETEE